MSSWIRDRVRRYVLTPKEHKLLDTVKKIETIGPLTKTRRDSTREGTTIKGVGPSYVYLDHFGVKRPQNDRELRELAETPTPAACINRLIKDVISTPWKVLPVDMKHPNTAQVNKVMQFLYDPNKYLESFESILAKTLRDVLVSDAGVIVKHVGKNDQLSQFVNMDGTAFLKEVDDQGNFGMVHDRVRYDVVVDGQKKTITKRKFRVGYWQHHNTSHISPIPYAPAEVMYLMQNPLSYSVYGQSPVEVLSLRLKILNQADMSNEKYFRKGEVAKQLLTNETDRQILEDADYERWFSRLDQALSEPHELIPTDIKSKLSPLGYSRKDFQWLEQQEEYRLSVCALFNVTPVMLGWTTRDVTKATDESQREVYMRKGLWPLLQLIEYHVNTELITDLFDTPEVYFTFDLYDPVDERAWIERCEIAAKCGIKTINEMRAERNLPPVKWGNLNPASIVAIQQFAQSVMMGGMTPEQFTLITGIPQIGELLETARQTAPETDEEHAKFWKTKMETWKRRSTSTSAG